MAFVSSSEKASSPQKTSEHGLNETPDSNKKRRNSSITISTLKLRLFLTVWRFCLFWFFPAYFSKAQYLLFQKARYWSSNSVKPLKSNNKISYANIDHLKYRAANQTFIVSQPFILLGTHHSLRALPYLILNDSFDSRRIIR